jgi:hypothetical protein
MNVSTAASTIALQTIAAQNALQPTSLGAAVNSPQSSALALIEASTATAQASDPSATLGTLIDTYA